MTLAATEPDTTHVSGMGPSVARSIVIVALTFNLFLSFVNASITPVSAAPVVVIELMLVALATLMIWNKSRGFLIIAIGLSAWLVFEMMMRGQFDAKSFRDGFIPIIFLFLGRAYGSPASGDRLVTIAIIVVAIGALFEWMFLDAFLKYFDVLGYYLARGSLQATEAVDGPGLFVSGLRFEGRTLLPFLGEHRVSSVFLEPVSLGNFAAIVFGWVLLRDRDRPAVLIAKTLVILMILVLGDARFGLYLCGVVLLCYLVAPLVRPTMVFVVPFLVVIALLTYAAARVGVPWDNTTSGRFLLSGQLLSTLDLAQAFGVRPTTVDYDDSGYSYVISQFGMLGAAALWGLYVYAVPAETIESWRFKLFVCAYLILLLAISTSTVTIKTGALLWFLAGSIAVGTRPAPRTMIAAN